MRWILIQNSYNTVHHTLSMLLHYLGKLEVQIWWKLQCALKTRFMLLAVTRWNLNWFPQFFYCCRHSEHLFICKEYQQNGKLEKFFRSSIYTSSAVRLSQLLRTSPLKAFQLQIPSYNADNRWLRNACLPWYVTDCAVSSGWSSWHRTISFTWSMFSSVKAHRGLSLPWRLSTVPVSLNFFSNLLMLLGVHPLFGNSALNSLAQYPFNWHFFC